MEADSPVANAFDLQNDIFYNIICQKKKQKKQIDKHFSRFNCIQIKGSLALIQKVQRP